MKIHGVSLFVFIIGWTIFSSCGLFAANPVPTKPKIISITENPFGPTVQTRADGTRIIKNQCGSSVQINPDGFLFIVNSDGSTIQKNTE